MARHPALLPALLSSLLSPSHSSNWSAVLPKLVSPVWVPVQCGFRLTGLLEHLTCLPPSAMILLSV